MKVVKTIQEAREIIAAWRKEGLSVGLVPTMGYLHEGHQSLIAKSVSQNDRTVVSVFVNPIQFGPNEDLEAYPRFEPRYATGGSHRRRPHLQPRAKRNVPTTFHLIHRHHRNHRTAVWRCSPHPLPWRLHRGGQTVQHRSPRPCILRSERRSAVGHYSPLCSRP